MAESKEELKSLTVKGESEKAGLKFNIQKTKIIASGPINSWQIDWETGNNETLSLAGAPKSLQRRKWQPTPVFLPGEFHGQRSLMGYSPWGHKESDTTEQPTQNHCRW